MATRQRRSHLSTQQSRVTERKPPDPRLAALVRRRKSLTKEMARLDALLKGLEVDADAVDAADEACARDTTDTTDTTDTPPAA